MESSHVGVLHVPAQELRGRLFVLCSRQYGTRRTVISVVLAPVLVLLLDSTAHLDLESFVDRDIALVEQNMQIGPKEQSVRDEVRARLGVGLDMRGLEDRQRALAGDGATPAIRLGDQDPECPLPETRARQVFRAVAGGLFDGLLGGGNCTQTL